MTWTIQDAFDKCGNGIHNIIRSLAPLMNAAAARAEVKQRVDAVANSIRYLGYTVECGTWEDRGYSCSIEADWQDPEDKLLATKANNYIIFSIRRPSGEYVYGSAESPTHLDESGIECRWNSSEVDKRWPLSGHKSLPHYLKTHFSDLVDQPYKLLGSDKTFKVVNGQDGVSGCGIPDWLPAEQFIAAFYLDYRMSTGYKDTYIKKLIGDRRVYTIANTLPPDIVDQLSKQSKQIHTHAQKFFKRCRQSHWEFMEG